MRERWKLRGEAILDGITGIVRVHSVRNPRVNHYYSHWRHKSDVERSWESVGRYMRAAMQEYEAETANGPRIRKSRPRI